MITLKELALLTGSQLKGDGAYVIKGAADLESAAPNEISFLANPRYLEVMRRSQAGAIFIKPEQTIEDNRNYLIHPDPSRAFQQVLEKLYSHLLKITGFTGVHPTAVVHPSATLGKNVSLGPHVVVDADVTIADNTTIGAGSYIGPGSVLGIECTLHAHVTLRERSILGNRVVIQPGAVIGSCGFGLTTDTSGQHAKLNQIGNVILEDDVEIGANTTIDRARFKSTLIRRGTKIDNLVQIAHNVIVGERSIVVAQAGIAGSTELGKGVVVAGQVGIAGHLKIADKTILTARTGVSKSLTEPGQAYGGAPAMPLAEYNRMAVLLRKIGSFVDELKALKEAYAKRQDGV